MRSDHGFRSLSRFDPAYNNEAIINPYSNWRGPIWINANFLDWIALRRYGFDEEAHWLAVTLASDIHRDIAKVGLHARGLRRRNRRWPCADSAQSPNGKFAGFVGWNLLAEDMLQCEVTQQHCMSLTIPSPQ